MIVNWPRLGLAITLIILSVVAANTLPVPAPDTDRIIVTLLLCFAFLIGALSIERRG